MNCLHYDNTSPESIEYYALNLVGRTFNDVLNMDLHPEFSNKNYENSKRKGSLGNLLEEHFFGYKANSSQEADFPEAGVELKVTPIIRNKSGSLRSKERLVITMISYDSPVEDSFLKSHVWNKLKLVLLIFYEHDKSKNDKRDFEIRYAGLFTPSPEDLEIIKQDYAVITKKIKDGRADEISEGDTNYLGACTKGATKKSSIVEQKFYCPGKYAQKRAFCLKNSYMTYVLQHYFLDSKEYDEKITSRDELANESFESIILNRITAFVDKSDKEIASELGVKYSGNKAQWNMLSFRMLGIKSNNAEEFKKANIVVKSIRVNKNGKIRESMSLPNYRALELIEEKWEDSSVYEYFSSTRFLFVVFKCEGKNLYLKGAQFWNMPYFDLETIAAREWHEIQNVYKNGVELNVVSFGNKDVVQNNLPKKSDTKILHVRPHTQKSYYCIGTEVYGNGDISDSDLLPNGDRMTKQSFWLNNDYVLSQLDDNLK